MNPSANVLGIPIQSYTMQSAVDRLTQFASGTEPRVAYAVYAECLNVATCDDDYRQVLLGSDMVYVDGMAVVWASQLLGTSLPQKLTTTDVIEPLAARCARLNYSFYLLGGKPGVADDAAKRLMTRFPGLRVVGARHGYFTEAETAAVVAEIRARRPQILLVGMGMPKQEKWIARNRQALGVPLLMSCGALLDFLSGRVPRGPRWMTDHGLEWLFRLLLEPRRLWRRYIIGLPLFFGHIALQYTGLRRYDSGLAGAAAGEASRSWRMPKP